MMVYTSVLFFSILMISWSSSQAKNCRFIGEKCSKTVFERCCGESMCQLSSLFHGICVKCLKTGSICVQDKNCCSHKCEWGKCKNL
ncbi:unnamed protein product [Heterobilharzia americana]|nr:unnamed protein product [Heterobilharzia americana]